MHAPRPWKATLGAIWSTDQQSTTQALIDVRQSACHSPAEWNDTITLVEAAPDMLARVKFCIQLLDDLAMAINHHCDIKEFSRDEWRTWVKSLQHYRTVLEHQHDRATDQHEH